VLLANAYGRLAAIFAITVVKFTGAIASLQPYAE
jgi:hypothetical protein